MDKKERIQFFYYENKNLNLAIQSYNCEILQRIHLTKGNKNVFYNTEELAPIKLRKMLEGLVILSIMEHLDNKEIATFFENLEYKDELDKESRMIRACFKYVKWSKKYPPDCKNKSKEIFAKIRIVSNNGEIHDGDNNFMMDYDLWYEVILFINETIDYLRNIKIEKKTLQYFDFCFLDKIYNNKVSSKNLRNKKIKTTN